jgi:hypothetical protein
MKIQVRIILILLLLNLLINCKTMKTTSLEYADGSGNIYKLNKNSIEYIPVKPENSSSGFYSGGVAAKKEISEQQFLEIEKLFIEIFDKKEIQIENRIKTSGVLTIVRNKKNHTIIISKSPKQTQIETELKKLLAK